MWKLENLPPARLMSPTLHLVQVFLKFSMKIALPLVVQATIRRRYLFAYSNNVINGVSLIDRKWPLNARPMDKTVKSRGQRQVRSYSHSQTVWIILLLGLHLGSFLTRAVTVLFVCLLFTVVSALAALRTQLNLKPLRVSCAVF